MNQSLGLVVGRVFRVLGWSMQTQTSSIVYLLSIPKRANKNIATRPRVCAVLLDECAQGEQVVLIEVEMVVIAVKGWLRFMRTESLLVSFGQVWLTDIHVWPEKRQHWTFGVLVS